MDIEKYLAQKASVIDKALREFLPSSENYPPVIHEAMLYSSMAPGKRIRPVLLLAAVAAVGGREEDAMAFACAIELIHTYSLIHDDLPAMDDSDYRRGKPSSHKAFNEAFAVLAGDALLTHAFYLMSKPSVCIDPKAQLAVTHDIAHAIGTFGLIGGQVVDIQSENIEIDIPIMEYIHTHKTGALIRVAVKAGGVLGGGKEEEIAALVRYADKVGLAFQIIDDILDEEGDRELTGKPVGGDKASNKSTYPAMYGINESKARAKVLIQDAITLLDPFEEKGEHLRGIAEYMLKRNR